MKINETQLRNTIKESVVKFLREEMVARHASERNHQHQWKFTPGDTKFNYMLLSRLQMDCDYFLGNGNRYEKNLWAGNVNDHIEMMKKIWNGFEEKPEWLSMEQIEDYERKMKNNNTNNDIDGMKINESQLRKIIRESINEIRTKKQPKTGKIQNKEGKWVDATEDGQDKNGNPMYRTKDSSITHGRKCKDGSRRVQDFNFRPNVNESQLRKIIKESIKKVLNEIYSTDGMGWMGLKFDEEDWIPVNEQSDGNTCFKIKVWCGSGPSLDAFKAYADHGDYEGALEALVAYLDKEGNNIYFTDEWTSNEIEELRKKGYSEEEIYNETEKWGDFYIDATHLGASKPHWLRGENLAIQEFPN